MATAKKTREQIISDYGLKKSNFSQKDLDLYDTNTDAFESISSAKREWNKANASGDTDGMKKANDSANRVRSTYSQYTGGDDGLAYNISPKYETDKPTYSSGYQDMINAALEKVQSRGEFSNKDYDLDTDPVWQSYKSKYEREGDLAYRDALAGNSARTGGIANSAALSAAQQAKNSYNAALTDVIPQLYEAAYQRYENETNRMNERLQLLRDMEATDYGRYRDDMSDWEKTRDYYNNNYMWQTERDDNLKQAAMDMAMNKWQTGGVANDDIAQLLGIQSGMRTADYDIAQQQIDSNNKWNEDSSNQSWAKIAQSQQQIDDNRAMEIWEMYGYATPEVAQRLGVPEGTSTNDVLFKQKEYELDKYKAEQQVNYQNASLALDRDKYQTSIDQFNQEMAYKNAQSENDKNYRYDALKYDDTRLENLPEMYTEMMSAEDPKAWVNENAKYMSSATMQYLLNLIYGSNKKTSSGAASVLGN